MQTFNSKSFLNTAMDLIYKKSHNNCIVEFIVITAEWHQMLPYTTQNSKFSWGHAPNPLAMCLLENFFFQIDDPEFSIFSLKNLSLQS